MSMRTPALPEVPTLTELGYNVEYYLWVGLFAPKATPEPTVETLRDLVKKAALSAEFKQQIANLGQEVGYLDQPEFKAFWDADAARIEQAVRTIGKIES